MRWMFGILAIGLATISFVRADDAAKPVAIDATDKAALAAAIGKDVVVSGTIKKAQWSSTGKVMNIEFENSDIAKISVYRRFPRRTRSAYPCRMKVQLPQVTIHDA